MKNLSALDKLAYIGRRGMGALEFVPPIAKDLEVPFKVEISLLHDLAKFAVAEAKDFKANVNHNIIIDSLFRIGTSAGGRRPKAIINVNLATGECYSGQVASPEPGYLPMIIKFDEHTDMPTTRIEYSYALLAKEAGLNMMPCYLIEEGNDGVHFMTQRFDRTSGGDKIHVQTLAAMMPRSYSYEDLFYVAERLGVSHLEFKQLFKSLVLNVICSNVDDHNKNFSFLMGRDGVWHVSPTYDFTFSVETSGPWYTNKHYMTVNGKDYDIGKRDLLAIAESFNINGAEQIIDCMKNVASDYGHFAELAGVDNRWTETIRQEIGRNISRLEM